MTTYTGLIEYENYCNGIVSNHHLTYEGNADWAQMLRRDIEYTIRNNFIHNTIRDKDGNLLFSAHEFITGTANPIRKKHTSEVPIAEYERWLYPGQETHTIRDDEAIRAEMEPIIEQIINEVFIKICESNGVSA